MTFDEALRVAAEIREYYRRLTLIAIGTFGRETEDWGCSVYIDGQKEARTVIWERVGLAGFSGGFVRQCTHCGLQRPLHVDACECQSTSWVITKPSDKSAVARPKPQPAGEPGQLSLF